MRMSGEFHRLSTIVLLYANANETNEKSDRSDLNGCKHLSESPMDLTRRNWTEMKLRDMGERGLLFSKQDVEHGS